MKNMIAIIAPNLNGGGAELAVVNLCNGISGLGYDVTLLLFSAEGPLIKKVNSKIDIVDLKTTRSSVSLLELSKELRRVEAQIAITALDNASVATLFAKKISLIKIPVIVTVHHPLMCAYRKANIKSQLLKLLIKLLFPTATEIIAVSRQVKDEVELFLGKRSPAVHVIPNPILYNSTKNTKTFVAPHDWFCQTRNVIFGCGRLSKEKDFGTLIKAVSMLPRHLDARLLIAGDGPQKKQLLSEIKLLKCEERVQLTGHVEDVVPYFYFASCFVLPSQFEGFGNVLVEALDHGCPVISTNCSSGPIDILKNGLFGELVEVGNPEKMANSILMQIENRVTRRKTKKLIEHLSQYRLDSVIKKYLDIVANVLPNSEITR